MYKINLINIKNFKSIVNISMQNISNFSIFAGANGAGKSNIFEAIEFFKTIVEFGAVAAIKRYGGYDNIHSRKNRKENARKFLFEIDIDMGRNYHYKLEVFALDSEPYLKEIFKIDGKVVAKRDKENIKISSNQLEINFAKDQTVLNLVAKESKEFVSFVKATKRYTIDPNLAREPDDFTSETVLDRDASNITTVLSNIQKNISTDVEEIVETMQLLIPSLENIAIQKEKLINKMVSTFKESGSKSVFPARLVSDGTIYALSILAIIYSNNNGIIMIEEPERGLHPKAISELVEFFREKSEIYPIFINTHNEAIIKKSLPLELFIVSKEDGKTKLFNILQEFPNLDYSQMDLNEMWLCNVFGKGLPW